jgi:hypothetical protein
MNRCRQTESSLKALVREPTVCWRNGAGWHNQSMPARYGQQAGISGPADLASDKLAREPHAAQQVKAPHGNPGKWAVRRLGKLRLAISKRFPFEYLEASWAFQCEAARSRSDRDKAGCHRG